MPTTVATRRPRTDVIHRVLSQSRAAAAKGGRWRGRWRGRHVRHDEADTRYPEHQWACTCSASERRERLWQAQQLNTQANAMPALAGLASICQHHLSDSNPKGQPRAYLKFVRAPRRHGPDSSTQNLRTTGFTRPNFVGTTTIVAILCARRQPHRVESAHHVRSQSDRELGTTWPQANIALPPLAT